MTVEVRAEDLGGKIAVVYEPRGGRRHSIGDIGRRLKGFATHRLLSAVAQVSRRIATNERAICLVDGVPASDTSLLFVALHALLATNDFRHPDRPVTIKDLGAVLDMFFGLPDPLLDESEEPSTTARLTESLLRLGQWQFDHQGDLQTALGRTLLLFRDCWRDEPQAAGVNPDRDLRGRLGLGIEESLLLGGSFYAIAEHPWVQPRRLDDLSFKGRFRFAVGARNRGRFLDWLSADAARIRTMHADSVRERPLSPELEKYRPNPLLLRPFIRCQVPGRGAPVLLAPIRRTIIDRVTSGVFHEIAACHEDLSFRNAFGHVFQRYVGRLLVQTVRRGVFGEIEYGPAGRLRRTPDWFVRAGETLVVIEAKHASLYRNARSYGLHDDVLQDLRKTLAKAVEQLVRFARDRDGGVSGLELLEGVAHVEHVLVSHGPTYWGNLLLRGEIERIVETPLPASFHYHVMPIEDLEQLLRCLSPTRTLFDVLRAKRTHADDDDMDFKDWLPRYAPGLRLTPAFPHEHWTRFVEDSAR